MRYAVVKANGSHEIVKYDAPLKTEVIQQTVAAPNETNATFEGIGGSTVSIFLNENGKYLSLPPNIAVTLYARANQMISQHDYVVGDCIIMGEPDDEGWSKDLNDEVLAEILSFYPKRGEG